MPGAVTSLINDHLCQLWRYAMIRIERRVGCALFLIGLLACVTRGMAQVQADKQDLGYFSGSWDWVDKETDGTITDVKFTRSSGVDAKGGPLKVGSGLPPELGGPSGIGANFWQFEGGTLSFIYRKTGRARVDDMLSGRYTSINGQSFQFKVTGGYYGQRLRGKVFVFKRQQ